MTSITMRCLTLGTLVLTTLTVCLACSDDGPAPPSPDAGARSKRPGTLPPADAAPGRPEVHLEADGAAQATWSSWPLRDRRTPEDPDDARKRPFDIEALYRLKDLSSPRWSPDGTRILFEVTSYDLPGGKTETDVYVVDADGTNLQQLTRFEGSDARPRWAPDGKSFLFVSTRKDGSQIWVMPIGGGEPRQLTTISTGVADPIWSPDGSRIAFASEVFPEHGADDAKNRALIEDIAASPIQAHIADHLLFRHWTAYRDGRRSHILVLDVATEKLSDLTPGDHDSPAFELGGVGFAFSPDSSEICFVSNREAPDAQAWTTNKNLYVVPTSGGPVTNLTEGNAAYDGHPAYSPDGRYLAFLRQEQPGYEADRFRLAVYDRQSGRTEILTEPFDNWVLDFVWAADGSYLLFRAAEKGRHPLFQLELGSRRISRVATAPSVREFDLSASGRIAFTHNSVGRPTELYVTDPKLGSAKRVTSFNDEVSKTHDIRPVEEMWVAGADGVRMHVFVVKPHGFTAGRAYPLILNVHGGPQYQWADAFRGDWQIYPGAGYVLAFPNPHGSIGYGQKYTAAISKDWSGKVYQDIMALTAALAELPYVDAERMGAMGWSWGGYMMNWLLGHTDRFKALASMMGVYDLAGFYASTEELWFPDWDLGGPPWQHAEAYRQASPSSYVASFKTPTLIITGEKDYRIPYTQSIQLFTALRRQQVPARLIIFPNDGHWPSHAASMPLYYAAHLDWFRRWLGGAPSPYDLQKMVQGRAFAEP